MHTVLLVEDNPDHVDLTLRAMRKTAFPAEVIVMPDGAEALAWLDARKAQELPCFVMLDLGLPHMDGLEVLKRIRHNAHTRYLPIVVFTTSEERSDKQLSYDLGANSYICKPVDYTLFVDLIHKLGEYWLSLNRPLHYGCQNPL